MPESIIWDVASSAAVILAPDSSIFAESEQLRVRATVAVSRVACRLDLDDLRRQFRERLLARCGVLLASHTGWRSGDDGRYVSERDIDAD